MGALLSLLTGTLTLLKLIRSTEAGGEETYGATSYIYSAK